MGIGVNHLLSQYDNLIRNLQSQLAQLESERAALLSEETTVPFPDCPVWLGKGIVSIGGGEIALLPGRETILVEAFAESPTHRLTTGEMERIGFPNPIGLKVIKQICRRYPALAPYITFPGVHNPGGAYHFRIIQSPERPV